MEQQSSGFFEGNAALSYDTRNEAWAPVRGALDLLMRRILDELPNEAHILCVGAGTGADILTLAAVNPRWRFTAVEPSAGMLEICRQKAEASGIASRCTFHHGFLDSLPVGEPFDAATSILVSQFILQVEERRQFFHDIARRLRPGGILVSADLACDLTSPASTAPLEVWLRMQRASGVSLDDVEQARATYSRSVAVVPPDDVESLIAESGFEPPQRFFQALLIHGWFTRRPI